MRIIGESGEKYKLRQEQWRHYIRASGPTAMFNNLNKVGCLNSLGMIPHLFVSSTKAGRRGLNEVGYAVFRREAPDL